MQSPNRPGAGRRKVEPALKHVKTLGMRNDTFRRQRCARSCRVALGAFIGP